MKSGFNSGETAKNESLTDDLKNNIDKFKTIFSYPLNKDFIIRDIKIRSINQIGVIMYLTGSINTVTIQRHIIEPLSSACQSIEDGEDLGDFLIKNIIGSKSAKKENIIKNIVDGILNGNTMLLIEGFNSAISMTTTEFEHRAIEQPVTETVLKGPKEAFIESSETNRSLIRKYVKNEKLITENLIMNNTSVNEIFIMYISNIADPELLNEVKKKINSISVDNVKTLTALEQNIENRPYSIVPTILLTERPDRAAAFLEEGHIALLMEGSPYSMIVPVTFWAFFHSPEDMYLRWAYGNFIRIIRMMAVLIALLTPGLYIAVSSYHADMIPTDLVLAIAASREKLPFPALIEVILMELSFDLLREAGVRVPTPIGPTIGIVGALILGQAAVQANIVSPILVIIVSITGLASFSISELSLNFMVRVARYIFLAVGALMGFYGISACFVIMLTYLNTIESFGVPFMAPVAPHYRSSKDTFLRSPVWKQSIRPMHLSPKDKIRKS